MLSFVRFLLCCLIFVAHAYTYGSDLPEFSALLDKKGQPLALAQRVVTDSTGLVFALDPYQVRRFDGYRFDKLKDSVIGEALYLDSKKRLWFSASYSLGMFDTTNNQFHQYEKLAGGNQALSYQNVRAIVEMPQGQIVVGTDDGLSLLNEKNGEFVSLRLQMAQAEKFVAVKSLLVLDDKRLLVGTSDGLFQLDLSLFDKYNQSVVRLKDPWLQAQHITTIIKVEEGLFAVGTLGGLYLLNRNNGVVENYKHSADDNHSISDNGITSLLMVSTSELWVGSNLGLDRFDTKTGRISRLHEIKGFEQTFGTTTINHLFRDGDTVYIATANGIFRHNIPKGVKQQLNPLTAPFAEQKQIKTVWSLQRNKDHTLVGTYGLGLFDISDNGTSKRYTVDGATERQISGNEVSTILVDSRGGSWVGTTKGLNYRASNDRPFKQLSLSSLTARDGSESVRDIAQDDNGNIWVLTTQELLRLKPNLELLGWYSKDTPAALSYNLWCSAIYLHDNYVLVGSDSGLSVIDSNTDKVLKFFELKGVARIFKDSFGHLWVLAFDALYQFDLKTLSLLPIADDNYFSDRSKQEGIAYYNLAEDNFGQLWIAYKGGARVFDIKKQRFVASFVTGAFADLKLLFGRNSMLRLPDGDFLFAELNGVSRFKPSKIKSKPLPKVIISAVDTQYEDAQTQPVASKFSAINELNSQLPSFQHGLQKVSFEFTSPKKLAGLPVQYKYWLEGFDSNWLQTSDIRSASYARLPSGEYSLWVKSVVDGRESKPLNLTFSVAPSMWLSWWALVFYVSALVALVSSLVRLRTVALESKVREVEQMVAQRTDELLKKNERVSRLILEKEQLVEDVFHQSRTPVQIMLANMNALKAEKLDISQYVEQQSSCIGQLLRLTDRVLLDQSMNKPDMRLQAVDKVLVQLVERYTMFSQDREFEFEWYIEPGISLWTDIRMMEDIVDNLLSNSFKYTKRGVVQLSVSNIDEHLVIRCQDTGIGIEQQQLNKIGQRNVRGDNTHNIQGSGIGLAIVEMFVDKLSGEIAFESKVGSGTKVEVKFLLKNQQEQNQNDAAEQHAQSQPVQIKPEPSEDTDNGLPQVLLIEDNKILADYYSNVLSEHYQVTSRYDGETAMEFAIDELPDVIVTDVMLGSMSGFELVETLRSNDITNHIPVIMLTAKGDFQSKLKGFESGANDYIVKPVQENELVIRIQSQLAFIRALERRFNSGKVMHDNVVEQSKDKLVEAYRQYIREHFGEAGISTGYISEQLFVTKKQLERKISQCLGTTPNHYLMGYRLAQAKQMLLGGTAIKVVYERCGFSSHAYFSKKFKEKYDCSPSEVKK